MLKDRRRMSFSACEEKKKTGIKGGVLGKKKRRRRENMGMGRKILNMLILSAVFIAVVYLSVNLALTMKKSIDSFASIKAKAMVAQVISEATREQFFSQATELKNLLIVNTDNEGNIELVQSNTAELNLLAAELNRQMKQKFSVMEPADMKLPLGSVLGSQILSQADFYVNLKVMPISVSNIEFLSEFESQGINQTKYRVYLSLTSKVRVISPFSTKTQEINSKYLIAEAVILGKVPESYVNVPGSEILDVAEI